MVPNTPLCVSAGSVADAKLWNTLPGCVRMLYCFTVVLSSSMSIFGATEFTFAPLLDVMLTISALALPRIIKKIKIERAAFIATP